MEFTWEPWFTGAWLFPLFCLIFMLAMAAMVIIMFRRGGGCMPFARGPRGRTGGDGESPRRILDRRYASGQISKEQHAAMRRDLDGPLGTQAR